ncbi:MAG: PD40 domain-containing protein [Bacteroidales bacterium]|nr:PD40 domain-containing protein [Bacteroidales bacterium]
MILVFVFGKNTSLYAQYDIREDFTLAEFDIMDELYEDAAKKFLKILKKDPDNCNFNYRLGYCYLHIPGKKSEAIPYLEKAIVNTSPDYKEGIFKETTAPTIALFYLGQVYRISNRLDDAIAAFRKFKDLNEDDYFQTERIDQEINSCERAKRLQLELIDYKTENLGDKINNKLNNMRPAVSDDLSTLAFTTINDEGYKDIYISTRSKDGTWNRPKNITDDIGSLGDCYTADLNQDGTELIVVQNDGVVADIYYSKFEFSEWSRMKKFKGKINSKYLETFASYSRDGKTLYFTSDRKESMGGLDIFRMEMDENGKWAKPENIGSDINTIFDEETPIMADENTMYFSSQGHDNMGGFDIFYSRKTSGGGWSSPVNIGYPVNTTDDDLGFAPIENGDYAYYFQALPDGYGALDIYKYEIFSENHQRNIVLKGQVNLYANEIGNLTKYSITLKETNTGDVLASVYPDAKGNFIQMLNPGSYQILFDVDGYEQRQEYIYIPVGYPQDDYLLNVTLAQLDIPEQEEETPLLTAETTEVPDNTIEPSTDTYQDYSSNYSGSASYTIQICATKNPPDLSRLSNANGVKVIPGKDGFNRCITGEFNNLSDANKTLQDLREKGFTDAFVNKITRYYGETPFTVTGNKNGYTIQIMALKRPVESTYFKNINGVKVSKGDDGYYRYTIGEYKVTTDARQYVVEVKQKGYADAFIRKLSSISNY